MERARRCPACMELDAPAGHRASAGSSPTVGPALEWHPCRRPIRPRLALVPRGLGCDPPRVVDRPVVIGEPNPARRRDDYPPRRRPSTRVERRAGSWPWPRGLAGPPTRTLPGRRTRFRRPRDRSRNGDRPLAVNETEMRLQAACRNLETITGRVYAQVRGGGQGRGRTADLPLFRRTLIPTELPDLGEAVTPARPRPPAASAVLTGFEPATSTLTGWRALRTALQDHALLTLRQQCPQRDSNPCRRLERAVS